MDNANESGTDNESGTTGQARPTRRPSPLLLLAGLAALLVSGWAIVGPFSLEPLADIGWISVISAVVVGAVLVLAPNRRK